MLIQLSGKLFESNGCVDQIAEHDSSRLRFSLHDQAESSLEQGLCKFRVPPESLHDTFVVIDSRFHDVTFAHFRFSFDAG